MSKFNELLIKINREQPFRKWSSIKSGGHLSGKIKAVKKILKILSGDDTISMLRDVLNQDDLDDLDIKYKTALSKIGELFQDKQQKYFKPLTKRIILKQIRASGITHSDAKSLGFKSSKYLWQICVSTNIPLKRGRNSIIKSYPDLVESINSHLDLHSSYSSNRTIKSNYKSALTGLREDIPIKYRKRSLKELFNSFKDNNEISFACFCSYIAKEFKKTHRETDLCGYCEKGKVLKKRIIDSANKVGFKNENADDHFNTEALTQMFKSLKNK